MILAHDRLAAGIAGLVVATVLAACGGLEPLATATARPDASVAVDPTPSADVPRSFGPPPSPTPDDATPLVIDSDLLAYLPESVEGIAVTEDVDDAAVALGDPALGQIAISVDAGVAVDAGTGNLVLGWIVRLRPGAFTDEGFRQWRDAYDDGACAAAGVIGRAVAVIGGREAYVTSCVGGLHTYHVWLEDHDILISASSLGADRFGEKLLEGLRVPA